MSQTPHVPPHTTASKPKPARTVEIIVNGKTVNVPATVTGAEIKAAACVPADFDLFRVKGHKEIPVANDERLTVAKGDKFIASPTLDPSFVEHPLQAAGVESVRETFPGHTIDVEQPGDGTAFVTVRQVAIGQGWNHDAIDLSVKLQVTFPSTPPYPFYGPAGLARTDGSALPPIQPQVAVDGKSYTQISLNKPFDAASETLGTRLAAVVRWLRDPR
jgi:hypothetical protein